MLDKIQNTSTLKKFFLTKKIQCLNKFLLEIMIKDEVLIDLEKLKRTVTGRPVHEFLFNYKIEDYITTTETISNTKEINSITCKIYNPCLICSIEETQTGILPEKCIERSNKFKDIIDELNYFLVRQNPRFNINIGMEDIKSDDILQKINDLDIIKEKIYFAYVLAFKSKIIEYVRERNRDFIILDITQEEFIDRCVMRYVSLKFVKIRIEKFICNRIDEYKNKFT